MNQVVTYNAAAYVRASRDDDDSNTIENQADLIRKHLETMPEIHIASVREDNGFSGVDFLRPSFTKMMEDVVAGKINCVIVKDLSRLGRNYIEVGELMEEIFPRYNVRLIAINDNYDSLNPRNDIDDIIVPFKNLINEQHIRDISVKIRSSMDVKRKNGEFVGNFAPYGYKRDPNNKHKVVVDDHAAVVVQEIFRLKIEGIGTPKIAKRLNDAGELSPADYKKLNTNYVATFRKNDKAKWDAGAIMRILADPVYIGTMAQGKTTTMNYKVRKRIHKPESEWNIVPDTHEAIISRRDFETVKILMNQFARVPDGKKILYPLGGYLYCDDCGSSMVRSKKGLYTYYVCRASFKKGVCSSHCMRVNILEKTVADAIASQITYVLDIEKGLNHIRSLPYQQIDIMRLDVQAVKLENELRSCKKYKQSLFEDYQKGVISKEDYVEFGKQYTNRINELQQLLEKQRKETELLRDINSPEYECLKYFTQYKDFTELSRPHVVDLIERIDINKEKQVMIRFRNQDKLKVMQRIVEEVLARQEVSV